MNSSFATLPRLYRSSLRKKWAGTLCPCEGRLCLHTDIYIYYPLQSLYFKKSRLMNLILHDMNQEPVEHSYLFWFSDVLIFFSDTFHDRSSFDYLRSWLSHFLNKSCLYQAMLMSTVRKLCNTWVECYGFWRLILKQVIII